MESTTRCTSCATEVSRSGDPSLPWKYLLATMLVAVCDQSTGTSTSRCSKITEPLSLPIEAVRVSHSISSYGVLPASSLVVKYRGNEIPVLVFFVSLVFNNSILSLKSTDSCPMNSPPGFLLGKRLRNNAPRCSGPSRIISPYSVLGLRVARPDRYNFTGKTCIFGGYVYVCGQAIPPPNTAAHSR